MNGRLILQIIMCGFLSPPAICMGLLLIMGIDQFLDMGRTATNVGNSITTAVVAKWEGEL